MSDWPFAPGYSGAQSTAPIAQRSFAVARWGLRFRAALLDGLLLLIPFAVLVLGLHQYTVTHYLTDYGTVGTNVTMTHGFWLDNLLWLLYPAWLLTRATRNGQTFGKRAAHVRVVRDDGRPVDIGTVLLREGLGKAIIPNVVVASDSGLRGLHLVLALYLLVDYLWPLWERENRALHDLLAATHVVRVPADERIIVLPAFDA